MHQQPWYWPPKPEYSVSSIRRVNTSSAAPIYTQGINLVKIVTADVPARNSTRSSADTMLTWNLSTIFRNFFEIKKIFIYFWWWDDRLHSTWLTTKSCSTQWVERMRITLNVRGPSYIGLTRSISLLLMPWLLTSPGHQQPWYWLCRIGRFLSYVRKDFNYLRRINVETWHKM